MLVKETRKLFKNTYQYKIVLVSPGATLLRGGDFVEAERILDSYDINNNKTHIRFKTKDSVEYCKTVVKAIKKLQNYEIRIEAPLISIYTNNKDDLNVLTSINEEQVKYISVPPNGGLIRGTVIMPKIEYEFKVTMGRTRQENSTFIGWADKNDKVKLTKSCRRDLTKVSSWGGTHFYINGEKNLLVARMMLGGCINKIEKVLKE